jgi:DNA-binding NtrC family response regulator
MTKVLILDDREDYLRALRGALRKEFEVVTVQTTEEAERLLDQTEGVVLIDIRLSEVDETNRDGIAFLQSAKARYPMTPMLMMSAYRDFEAAVEALNWGADYFFKKPIDLPKLKEFLHDFGTKGLCSERTAELRRQIEQENK